MTGVHRRPADRPGATAVDPLLVLGAAVAGLVAAATAWLWATAKIAGRVFGGAWPDLPAAAAAAALVRLARDPTDPASLFAPQVARLLPETISFYATAGLLAAVPCAVVVVAGWVWRASGRRADRRHGVPDPAARWAQRSDLRALVVNRAQPARLTLGRVDSRLVAAEPLQSLCLFGPTRSGKTSAFAVPAVLEWQGPAIVCSVKTDLAADTMAHRQAAGEVKVFDPLGLTPWPAASWSPLGRVGGWGDARRVAYDVARVSQASHGLTQSDFWLESAADLLAPLFFAASSGGFHIADVVRWVQTPHHSAAQVMEALEDAAVAEAVAAFQAVLEDDPKTRSNIFTTTRQFLAAFADPTVAASSHACDITPAWLHAGPGSNTLYLCAPSHDQDRLRPLFVSLLQEQIRQVYQWHQSPDDALQRPLLVVLDEAANIAAMPELDHLASTCAGHRIQLVTIFQDFAQVRARWGARAQTVVNNHRATVFLSGLKDDATLKYAADLLGEKEVVRESTTKTQGSTSTTESSQHRPLAPPDVLRRLTPNHGVLVYGHLPPALLQLRPWYAEADLMHLARRAETAIEEAKLA